jgi:hypothetical protein
MHRENATAPFCADAPEAEVLLCFVVEPSCAT